MQLYIILYIDKHTIIYNIQTYQLYRCLWLHNATYDRIFYIYYNITYVIPFIKKIIYMCVWVPGAQGSREGTECPGDGISGSWELP